MAKTGTHTHPLAASCSLFLDDVDNAVSIISKLNVGPLVDIARHRNLRYPPRQSLQRPGSRLAFLSTGINVTGGFLEIFEFLAQLSNLSIPTCPSRLARCCQTQMQWFTDKTISRGRSACVAFESSRLKSVKPPSLHSSAHNRLRRGIQLNERITVLLAEWDAFRYGGHVCTMFSLLTYPCTPPLNTQNSFYYCGALTRLLFKIALSLSPDIKR